MKKILFSLLVVVLFASCEDKTVYTIAGTFSDVENGTEVILSSDRKGEEVVTTTTVQDGKFLLEGKQVEPAAMYLNVTKSADFKRPIQFVLEAGQIVVSSIDGKVSFTGTPLNDANVNFWTEFRKHEEPNYDLLKSFINENISNALGVMTLASNYYIFDFNELKDVFGKLSATHKALAPMVKLAANIEAQENTAVGKKFINIQGLTPHGKEMAMSDYAGKGKIVLVDFWASWCPPCVKDMPHLVAAYAKYKDKGFEIVGVSIDSNNDDWKAGIEKLGITWPQVSDLKGWESELSKPYAVSSIPHTILLDKDGVILEKQIHGADLDAKLAEIFK